MPSPPSCNVGAAALLLMVSILAPKFSVSNASAQSATTLDPGPRGGTPGAGGPMPGLNSIESAYFAAAQARFIAIDSVTGNIGGQSSKDLDHDLTQIAVPVATLNQPLAAQARKSIQSSKLPI
jgi:hypothetical protein